MLTDLRERIAGGKYPPHSYLPAEREFAADLRTSRVTLRRALAELERMGLVARAQGRGTRVLPTSDATPIHRIAIVHGELPSIRDAAREDHLRTLQGARDTFGRRGQAFSVLDVPRDHAGEQQLTDHFGAMLFIENSFGDPSHLARLQKRNIPFVVAKLELETELAISATWVDHEAPMREAVATFVNLGHRRIAFVGRETTFAIHGKARAGYLAGMRAAGLEVDESLIGECQKTDALSGYVAARNLLRHAQPPTAILAARDSIAEGVCRAIEEAGLTLGLQVSVIGFDDTTWPEGREFLTTFGESCYEMGAAAAELLLEHIADPQKSPERRQFDTPFILRRSAGPFVDPSILQSVRKR